MKFYKDDIIDSVSYFASYIIVSFIYLYASNRGLLDVKADLFQLIGILFIMLIWICLCHLIGSKVKGAMK